ncbi:MAG: RNA methyltransferase [Bacteroidota bacterium]
MISNNQIKFIKSLQTKKFRNEYGIFIAEGDKISKMILKSDYKVHSLYATNDWLNSNHEIIIDINHEEVSINELGRISSLKTPQEVLVVVKIADQKLNPKDLLNQLTLVFDEIKDPGNLGTVIRIADWFGIKNIICSLDSVDSYNPKVIQATMGSFCNVKIHYYPLDDLFNINKKEMHLPVYGTLLNGENIYHANLKKEGLIVFGNESKGIDQNYYTFINESIKIPSIDCVGSGAESLNIGVSVGIVCSEFMRYNFN